MHVGVKISVAQRMAQEHLHHPIGQHRTVMARCVNGVDVRHLDAFGPVQRQHRAPRQGPFDARYLEPFVAGDIGREFSGRRRLCPQVKFLPDGGLEMRDHIHRAQTARGRRQPFDHPRRHVEGVDISGEGARDARP